MKKHYRVQDLGSAKTGTDHWWMQRLTAMLLPFLMLASLYILVQTGKMDYAAARVFLGNPMLAAILGLTLGLIFYHMVLGLQVVIEDYISTHFTRLVLLTLVRLSALVLIALAFASLVALL